MQSSGVRRYAALGIIFILGIIIGVSIGPRIAPASSIAERTESGTASIMFDYGDGEIDTYQSIALVQDETLFTFTRRVAKENNIAFGYKEYTGLGAFITQIGQSSQEGEDASWQYWVNNTYGTVGVSTYEVQPNDVIVWKFTKGQRE